MSSLKNLIIDQGTTFKEFINYVDKTGTAINVSGFAARCITKFTFFMEVLIKCKFFKSPLIIFNFGL